MYNMPHLGQLVGRVYHASAAVKIDAYGRRRNKQVQVIGTSRHKQ